MHGQVSIETLFLAALIISGTILITSYYLQTQDDTILLTNTRLETLKQIGASEKNIVIESIRIEKKNTDANVYIKLTPKTNFNPEPIKEIIANTTKYKNPNIIFE